MSNSKNPTFEGVKSGFKRKFTINTPMKMDQEVLDVSTIVRNKGPFKMHTDFQKKSSDFPLFKKPVMDAHKFGAGSMLGSFVATSFINFGISALTKGRFKGFSRPLKMTNMMHGAMNLSQVPNQSNQYFQKKAPVQHSIFSNEVHSEAESIRVNKKQ